MKTRKKKITGRKKNGISDVYHGFSETRKRAYTSDPREGGLAASAAKNPLSGPGKDANRLMGNGSLEAEALGVTKVGKEGPRELEVRGRQLRPVPQQRRIRVVTT